MTQNEQVVFDTAVSEGLDKINPLLPGFLVAQAGHESNDFTSDVFKKCNNGFGYKFVGQKLAIGPCTKSPEGDAYAEYKSLADSTREMCGWIKRREPSFKNVKTPEQYAAALKDAGYYGDALSRYSAAMVRHYNNIKDGVTDIINKNPEVSILTGITILSMVSYYVYRVAKLKR
jgi:uncharacterized FlgJ-related protein